MERHNGIIKSRLKKIMEEIGKIGFSVYHPKMHITPTSARWTPFEKRYGRPFVLPQLKPFNRHDEKKKKRRNLSRIQILTSREISSV